MEKLYLDNCCFNRPYDDQTQVKIHIETQAKLYIQEKILEDKYALIWSYILEYENFMNPYETRRDSTLAWKSIASFHVVENNEIISKANMIRGLGIKPQDAIHLASAIYAKANYFITTDKGILGKEIDEIEVLNPVDFIRIKEG